METVRAHAGQAALLSLIAWKAKAAWQYPAHWMERWRPLLQVSPEQIEANHYFAAETDVQIVGFCGVHPAGAAWSLEHLWVLPEHWGAGVGRRLFLRATDCAREGHARSLAIEADPNAEAFYLRMGAKRVGGLTAELDGQTRVVPQLLYTVPVQAGC